MTLFEVSVLTESLRSPYTVSWHECSGDECWLSMIIPKGHVSERSAVRLDEVVIGIFAALHDYLPSLVCVGHQSRGCDSPCHGCGNRANPAAPGKGHLKDGVG
jgi:hypothetical protein